jgi:hypothetical protein
VKVSIGGDGKLVTYGLDGESARNYVKHGLYVRDAELPPFGSRWIERRRRKKRR